MLTEFVVNTNLDPATFSLTDSEVSLREAIARAEQSAGADIITFSTDPAHGLNGATIKLQYIDQPIAALTITQDVTIDATMLSQGITLDAIETEIDPNTPGGHDGLRVFDLGRNETFGLDVTLAGLTITGGDADAEAGGIVYRGGAGNNVIIRDSKITGNTGRTNSGLNAIELALAA